MNTLNNTKTFEGKSFEGENDFLWTFQGHNNSFCIMLNGKCISSLKTLSTHKKKLNDLILKLSLIEEI